MPLQSTFRTMKKLLFLLLVLLPAPLTAQESVADSTRHEGWGGPFFGLHRGLNARFDLSVTAGLGKHSPRGAGFGQNVELAYATPLGKRGFFAASLYAGHFNWGDYTRNDVGISALLGYKATDWMNVYAFAQKSLVPHNRTPLLSDCYSPLVLFDRPKDEFGAAVEFKLREHASFTLSVSRRTYEDDRFRHDLFSSPHSGLQPYRGLNW